MSEAFSRRIPGRAGFDLEVIVDEEAILSHVTKSGAHRTNVRLDLEGVRRAISVLQMAEKRLTPEPAAERQCRACGCTDARACWPTCWWVEPDLCSMCAKQIRDHFRQRSVL